MLYVALANAAALVVVTITLASILRWNVRQHARERERLVDQLCHLTGRPWNDAPAARPTVEPERDWESTWESQAPEQMVA